MNLFVATTLGVALAGLVLAAGWAYFRVVLPARRLHGALEALAQDGTLEEHGFPASGHPGVFRRSGQLLERLAGRLREMDRQLGDESFNLQAILGGLSEGVLIVDRTQKIRLANAGLRRMFDLDVPPINRTLLEVFRHHVVQRTVLDALNGGEGRTHQLTLPIRQDDGRYLEKHFDLTASGLLPRGADQPVGAIAIFHDITRTKNLETVRRDFVANVSHELRTPLSIINGYLETLLEDNGRPLEDRRTVERFLQVMWKHGQRLNLLIEDLLILSRLESGSAAAAGLRFEPVPLRACLERVIERLAPIVAEKGATIRLDVPADAPAIEADPLRLDQVFFNLLDNALKYGPNPGAAPGGPSPDHPLGTAAAGAAHDARAGAPGVPKVGVNGHHSVAGLPGRSAAAALALLPPPRRAPFEIRVGVACRGDQVYVNVTDNGSGIPLADQPHIFERFYRVDKARSRDAGGTGLGLSIVKHVVQAHGGQVSLESCPGEGATFRLRLPVVQSG